MSHTPIKFKRMAAAFDDSVRWARPCDSSSGSEHWPDSGISLSDLVSSFINKGDGLQPFNDLGAGIEEDDGNGSYLDFNDDGNDKDEDEVERKELLRDLLLECERDNKNGVKQTILHEIEGALKLISQNDDNCARITSRITLKRNLMSYLRDKGFDAGLCKSRWEKTTRYPAGSYEYIDINIGKTRYIIEVFLVEELEIARPTAQYTALLNTIPSILIIDKPKLLKQIIRVMCDGIKESLKSVDMYVAPWRRNGYMQAKYFSAYKRTIGRESSLGTAKLVRVGKSLMGGFEGGLARVGYCREGDFGGKGGGRVGFLSAALQGR